MTEPLTDAERDRIIEWATQTPLYDETWQSVYLNRAATEPVHDGKHRAASVAAFFRTPLVRTITAAGFFAAVVAVLLVVTHG